MGRKIGHGSKLSRYKYEDRIDREQRHQRDVIAAGRPAPLTQHVQQGFDVMAWDRMHREAEQQTLQLGPVVHGASRRREHAHDIDNVAHPGHPSNIGDR